MEPTKPIKKRGAQNGAHQKQTSRAGHHGIPMRPNRTHDITGRIYQLLSLRARAQISLYLFENGDTRPQHSVVGIDCRLVAIRP